jgi:hypothetical protein
VNSSGLELAQCYNAVAWQPTTAAGRNNCSGWGVGPNPWPQPAWWPRDAHVMAAGCGAASDGSSTAGNRPGKETRAVVHRSDESTVRRRLRFGNGCSTTASGEVLVGLAGELL